MRLPMEERSKLADPRLLSPLAESPKAMRFIGGIDGIVTSSAVPITRLERPVARWQTRPPETAAFARRTFSLTTR
jgi:hypothetical protein